MGSLRATQNCLMSLGLGGRGALHIMELQKVKVGFVPHIAILFNIFVVSMQ